MDKIEYPRVTRYTVKQRGKHAHVFQHSATIELDEARSFPVSSVSSHAEKDEDWLLSLFVQEWPEPDTRPLEERVAKLESQLAMVAAYVSTMPVPIGQFPEDCHRQFQDECLQDPGDDQPVVVTKDNAYEVAQNHDFKLTEQPGAPAEYTEGICSDGAAILKDGEQITISEILSDLNKVAELKAQVTKTKDNAYEVAQNHDFKLTEQPGTMTKVCEWKEDNNGNWFGTCGVGWTFNDAPSTPKEHDMNYCPRCGAVIMALYALPPGNRDLSYNSKEELNRNSVLLDDKGLIKANKMIDSGRTIGYIGRNSLGIIAHFYLEDEQP